MSRNQTIFPRYSVLPMKAAIDANTRLEVPSRPGVAVAEERVRLVDITATGHSALRRLKIFSQVRLGDALPLQRKLRNFTQGMPISPAKQVARNVLPVPTGPATR